MIQDNLLGKNIDKVTTICTLLIIFLHSYNYEAANSNYTLSFIIQNFISNGLTRTAVPIFFIVSGYLYFNNKNVSHSFFTGQLKKRIRSLGIPFLVWSLGGFLLFMTGKFIPVTSNYFNSFSIEKLSLYDVFIKLLVFPVPYQLWFLQILLICSILAPVIWFLINKLNPYFSLSVLGLLWLKSGGYNGLSEYFFEGVFFYAIGISLALNKTKNYKINLIVLFIVGILSVSLKTYLSINASYTISYLWGKIAIIICIPLVWIISNRISFENKMMSLINRYKFWIFLSHEPMLTFNKKWLLAVLNSSELSHFIVYLLAPLLTLCQSLILANIIIRIFPAGYNVLVGGRIPLNKNSYA